MGKRKATPGGELAERARQKAPPEPHEAEQKEQEGAEAGWRKARQRNPLIGDRELGDFGSQVALAIALGGGEATSLSVVDFIVQEAGEVPDHPQTHASIKKLLEREPDAFADVVRKTKSTKGGPKIRRLSITKEGVVALARKRAQARALAELFEKYSPELDRLCKAFDIVEDDDAR